MLVRLVSFVLGRVVIKVNGALVQMNTGLLVMWSGVVCCGLVRSGLVWSGLVCKDSQDELVSLYIGFYGCSDDSYVIYANIHWRNTRCHACTVTDRQWKVE